jgi:4-alpha-glucanotransferase
MSDLSETRSLHQLARLYGVQTAYYDMFGHRCETSVEALLAVLRLLGAPMATVQDIPSAWRERRQAMWQQKLEPVVVVWDGKPLRLKLRLPSHMSEVSLTGHLTQESGERQSWEWHGVDLPSLGRVTVEGTGYILKRLPLPERLPWGYHRFTLELAGEAVESLIIAAPFKAYSPLEQLGNQAWGVFLPLYALHTRRSWGCGDLSDMEALIAWVSGKGGSVVGTLPLLSSFPDEPSPYTPASRLLWNELYLDVTRVPELSRCPSAQAMLVSSAFQKELETLRNLSLVDYPCQMALKRRILEELCRYCFAEAPDRLKALQHFIEAHPLVEDYARFRAAGEKQHASWSLWPQPPREGVLKEGDYDEEAKRYHLYVQWLIHEQIQSMFEKAHEKGIRLYLDLPLGVHPDSYDIWRYRTVFALDASGGAPPDAVFGKGQNWGFPPLHPEGLRKQGYSYYIACLRHHLRHGGILRIDHAMCFHRLFWIPEGFGPQDGLYVRYPAEEFYAILSLESHRHRCWLVGENLGTVPSYINQALRQHNVHRMYVVQYEIVAEPNRALTTAPADSVAIINTHDMPTFSGFWQGLDIEGRLKMGLLDRNSAGAELEKRRAIKEALLSFLQQKGFIKASPTDLLAVLRAILAFLCASPSPAVLVNLEDLWLETQPQNVPGTGNDFANWRHKARYALEAFSSLPEVQDLLEEMQQVRRQRRN